MAYESLTFDLKYVMLTKWKDFLSQFSAFDNANTLCFENGHSHPLPHMVVHYSIFKASITFDLVHVTLILKQQRLYSQGGLTGNDRGFEHSICACRGHAASVRHRANM